MQRCQGVTCTGSQCRRLVKAEVEAEAGLGTFCFQHLPLPLPTPNSPQPQFCEQKPSECIICYTSLANQSRPLICGHWIHTDCVIKSAKAECPLCRRPLHLNKKMQLRIDRLAKIRKAEALQEEEDDLHLELEAEIAELIAPAIEELLTGGLLAELCPELFM